MSPLRKVALASLNTFIDARSFRDDPTPAGLAALVDGVNHLAVTSQVARRKTPSTPATTEFIRARLAFAMSAIQPLMEVSHA
ncbi:MAG: hypothetical protein IH626_19395 [Rhodospirillales bacterium]|nr:hypothetical protein [Rhodospirillales bacterium]